MSSSRSTSSWRCIDGPDARIKMYMRTGLNNLQGARRLCTLGGLIRHGDVEPALRALAELWPLFHGLRLGDLELETREVYPRTFGLGASVELKPDEAMPVVKIHFPTKILQLRDGVFADAMAQFFRQRGDPEFADTFRADLERALKVGFNMM